MKDGTTITLQRQTETVVLCRRTDSIKGEGGENVFWEIRGIVHIDNLLKGLTIKGVTLRQFRTA